MFAEDTEYQDSEYIPDAIVDNRLEPCQKCGADYNIVRKRRGPTVLMFTSNQYRVICLNCWSKGKMSRTVDRAIEAWNNQYRSRLRELRLKHGLTQIQLGEMVGCSDDTIIRIEKNRRAPWPELRKRLAETFNVEETAI